MKKFFTLIALAVLCSASAMAYDTWSVVGVKAIVNGTASWAETETTNDMTTTDGTTYTLTVTDKTLEAGSYEYKFIKDHAWTTSFPQSGNYSLTVSENGVYNIEYTVNVESGAYSAELTKAGESGEITHTYSIAGDNTNLFSASWSASNTATDMTKGDDGVYTWTKSSVALPAGDISYKVVEDHSWDVCYPSSNATLSISEAASYDVTITFNPNTKEVIGTATKVGEAVVTVKYYLKHPWGTGADSDWTVKELTTDNGDGTYSLEALYGGTGCNWGTNESTSNWVAEPTLVNEPAVGNLCTFTLNPTAGTITITKLSATVTISDACYATYYNSKYAYTMPDDCEGYVFAEGQLQRVYDAESVVPAGEPLVIYTIEPGTKTLTFTTSSENTYKSLGDDYNALYGTDTETALTPDANSYFYALSLAKPAEGKEADPSTVGFYWMNETGAAFTNGAHKAYLKLAKTSGSKSAYLFNDEATAINAISTENTVNAPAYNLAGQRVNTNAKGIVIMNGHKYINK